MTGSVIRGRASRMPLPSRHPPSEMFSCPNPYPYPNPFTHLCTFARGSAAVALLHCLSHISLRSPPSASHVNVSTCQPAS